MKRLPSGAALQKVDGIHQRKLGFLKEKTYVYAKFEGHPPNYLPIELLTMLVIGSRYENKKRLSRSHSIKYRYKVSREPEAISVDSEEHRVSFLSDDGVVVEIRQLEVARTLFFHNIHFVKTAFRQNGLASLAQVTENEFETVIKINNISNYPVSRLRSRAECQHFAWLILDKNARKSFNSILKNWMESDVDIHEFRFQPPPMIRWKIEGYGHYVDRAGEKVFVMDEITDLSNPDLFHTKKVIIDHPRSKNIIVSEPSNGIPPIIRRTDDDPLLDLSVDPVFGKRIDLVTESNFSFVFAANPTVKVKDNGDESQVKPRVDAESEKTVEKSSVGDIDERGEACELDYGINQSEDDIMNDLVEADPTDKFRIFEKVMHQLGEHPGFNLNKVNCYKMPNPKSGRLAVTRTKVGKIVQCHVAVVKYSKTPFIIIEIDTENMKTDHSISTLIVAFEKDPDTSLTSVLQSCSDDGVRWPRNKIDELSVAAEYCHHPRRMKKVDGESIPLTSEEYQKAWLDKFKGLLVEAAKGFDLDFLIPEASEQVACHVCPEEK
jgi:hypothetical protein